MSRIFRNHHPILSARARAGIFSLEYWPAKFLKCRPFFLRCRPWQKFFSQLNRSKQAKPSQTSDALRAITSRIWPWMVPQVGYFQCFIIIFPQVNNVFSRSSSVTDERTDQRIEKPFITRPDTRHKMRLVCVLFTFEKKTRDGRTDGPTDTTSYS